MFSLFTKWAAFCSDAGMCTLHVKIWDFCQVLGLKQYRVPPNSHFKLYCHLLYASLTMLVYVGVRLIASSCLNSICKQAHRLTHPYSHTLRPHRCIWIVWCLCTNQINILFENWEPHTFTWKTFPCVHQS